MGTIGNQIRVNVSDAKASVPTRTACATTVGITAPNSLVWKAHPEIQAAGNGLVASGTALGDAQANVDALQKQLEAARTNLGAKIAAFDAAHALYAANVQTYAAKPEDVPALGLSLFTRNAYALEPPLGILATFDGGKGEIRIRVKRAPGLPSCLVEISADPVGPSTWTRLPGFGGVKKLTGYAPGTYWVRAASARANECSDFAGPVAVIVR